MITGLSIGIALILLATGLFKLVRPREALLATGHMNWVAHTSDAQVRGIATLELLAVVGLIAPQVFGIAPFVVQLAAAGVIALMAGAAVTHSRLGEHEKLPLNLAIATAALAVVVAG